jgi:RHS repeat-associated protein
VEKVVNQETNRFIYDGWNLVRELRTGNSEQRTNSYVWGLDLSGSLQGAGGIGGLLSSTLTLSTNSTTLTGFYAYDANGNVTELVDDTGTNVAAAYTYDPYGNLLSCEGTLAQINPFRFSTKYLEDRTGLYYYGYRYYDGATGRWLSRDPFGEQASLALYCFARNSPIERVDLDGRDWFKIPNPLNPDDKSGHIIKVVESVNDDFLTLVGKHSDNATAVYNQGRSEVLKAVELARNSIELKEISIGDGPQYDADFYEKIGKQIDEGGKIKVPKGAFIKAGGHSALFIYQFFRWADGGEGVLFEDLVWNLQEYKVESQKSVAEKDMACLLLCQSLKQYLAAVPDSTGYGGIIAQVAQWSCHNKCYVCEKATSDEKNNTKWFDWFAKWLQD